VWCGSDRGWWLPAGHVDPNESFQDAARRETMEEAGIDVNLVTLEVP
jgi:8-oxo-dGTP pyrophosphatase MutT (NUDIX family)